MSVIKLSQTISGEIVLENLIDALMRTAIEHAGAERALLIHAEGDVYRLLAEATIDPDGIAVERPLTEVSGEDLPVSVLNYVTRTKERIAIHDASQENQFPDDDYIHQHHARSILCLPLLKQTRLVGVLYLENNLAAHVFSPAKMSILTLVASETAISLENMRLYEELQDREAKIRRLIDSNIVGIFNWDLDGRILDANDAFLRIVGYEREDLASGRLCWTDLTPPEWRDRDAQRQLPELKTSGSVRPYEKEYFRKDGSRVPILIGAASFKEGGEQGVAFVLDLTDRKRAEDEARESEQRYREVQMELAHANRVATIGQLSASIAHEINQPIGAAITYADAGLRWLDAHPPNLEEVRRAFGVILESSVRAGEVMGRIRALIRKAPLEKASLEINEVILEVIALIRREIEKNGISVRTELVESLPMIQGDRVQLQQVLLNLLVNAIEAMSGMSEGQRELLISTAQSGSGVVVSVGDSGPGLMLENVERLFESFYTTKPAGLGMGLSICRSIVEAHGGRLWASANEPRGAVFQFTLVA